MGALQSEAGALTFEMGHDVAPIRHLRGGWTLRGRGGGVGGGGVEGTLKGAVERTEENWGQRRTAVWEAK